MRTPRDVVSVAIVAASVAAIGIGSARVLAQTPVFRGGTTIVPLDISVLDRRGQPVTDLTPQDFTILEDGVHQDIRSFFRHALAPLAPDQNGPPVLIRASRSDRVAPITRRTFLIVLGWGRIQEPTKAIDATLRFIRDRLLPQDLVGVLAFDRVTDLMTDHEQVAAVVERYKQHHEAIVQELAFYFDGHPGMDIPPAMQADIDALFDRSHVRNATNLLVGTDEFQKLDDDPRSVTWNKLLTVDNLLKTYAGIEYLHYLEGEKHLIVCARGLLPGDSSVQDDERLAARANDARIVLDIIHTGGVPAFHGFPPPTSTIITDAGFYWGAQSSEDVANLTGGQFRGTVYADETFGRVDQATRFGYLIGYAPTNAAADDRYRKVAVKVNRPDVTVLFRHGYHPQQELPPLDLEPALTASRVAAVANFDQGSSDIAVTASASRAAGLEGAGAMDVDVMIDPSRLSWVPTRAGGASDRTGSIDVTIFCGDAKQRVVGTLHRVLKVSLAPNAMAHMTAAGIPFHARVPVTAETRFVKIVVYDYGADLSGTATVTIKRDTP